VQEDEWIDPALAPLNPEPVPVNASRASRQTVAPQIDQFADAASGQALDDGEPSADLTSGMFSDRGGQEVQLVAGGRHHVARFPGVGLAVE
jgi:hypothetical protein